MQSSSFQLRTLTVATLGGGLVATIIFCLDKTPDKSFAFKMGACVALFSGAALLGILLGFLFGIPRTQQRDPKSPSEEQNSDINYQINTNLEQISDWLTKIIIGIGLVQLNTVGKWLSEFSGVIGNGFAPDSAIANSFVMGMLLYFSICGFLLGYLWTRLFFGIAVRQADQGLVGRIEKWEAEARADAKAISLVSRQLNRMPGDAAVVEHELQEAVVRSSSHTRTKIYYDALAARRSDERKALSIPVFRALIASDSAQIYHQNLAQLAYALKDKSPPEWEEAERLLTDAIRIRDHREDYEPGDYEFNRAICRICLNMSAADVEEDLRKAAENDWVRTWSLERWKPWLTKNGLNPKGLGFDD